MDATARLSDNQVLLVIGVFGAKVLEQLLTQDCKRIVVMTPVVHDVERLISKLGRSVTGQTTVECCWPTADSEDKSQRYKIHNLPDANGFSTAESYKALYPGLRVIKEIEVPFLTLPNAMKLCDLALDNVERLAVVMNSCDIGCNVTQDLISEFNNRPFKHCLTTLNLINEPAGADDASCHHEAATPVLEASGFVFTKSSTTDKATIQCFKRNPLLNKLNSVREKVKEQAQALDDTSAKLESTVAALEEQKKDFEKKLTEKTKELKTFASTANELKQSIAKLKSDIAKYDDELKLARSETQQLQERNQSLESQMIAEKQNAEQLLGIRKHMDYLFEQQRLQLEQATNELGRHVSRTANTTQTELEASIALQHSFGGGLKSLNNSTSKISKSAALALSKLIEDENYDVIIEFGSGETTLLMAEVSASLRNQRANQMRIGSSNETSEADYYESDGDELPKRIISFEHVKSDYERLQEKLTTQGLIQWVNLKFAPLISVQYSNESALLHKSQQELERIQSLLAGRNSKVLVLANERNDKSEASFNAKEIVAHVLQYLTLNQIDFLAFQNANAGTLTNCWKQTLQTRAIEFDAEKLGEDVQIMLIRVNLS